MRRIWPILGLLALLVSPSLAWATPGGSSLPSKRFQVQVPADSWRQMNTADELGLQTSAKVEMYLKRDNGSLILLRSGRDKDFGLSPYFTFASDEAETVYLMKLIQGGDYIDEVKLESKNPLLSHAKAYSYKVQDKRLGQAKTLVVMLRGRDTVLIEFLASLKNFDKDRLEFYKFLDSLKEQGK